MTFDGRWPLMEDTLRWETTFDGRRLFIKRFRDCALPYTTVVVISLPKKHTKLEYLIQWDDLITRLIAQMSTQKYSPYWDIDLETQLRPRHLFFGFIKLWKDPINQKRTKLSVLNRIIPLTPDNSDKSGNIRFNRIIRLFFWFRFLLKRIPIYAIRYPFHT